VSDGWNEVVVRITYHDDLLTPAEFDMPGPVTEEDLIKEIEAMVAGQLEVSPGMVMFKRLPRAFLLHRSQGGGCDYTIACGEDISHLRTRSGLGNPTNLDEAFNLAISKDFLGCEEGEDYGPISSNPGEAALMEAHIYEVVHDHVIDLPGLIEEAQARLRAEKAKQTESDERAEYERLKAKYGGAG